MIANLATVNVRRDHARLASCEPDYLTYAPAKSAQELREERLGHRGVVIWLTGLSGAGKSTLANAAHARLLEGGLLAAVLDGDVLRTGLCRDLGYSEIDRKENIRRVAETALLMADAGLVVITALISPYAVDRQRAAERSLARGIPFAEVYVNAPLEVCEQRDPKQMYAKARRGELRDFTGVSSPYHSPVDPMLELRTDQEPVTESVERLVQLAMALASLDGVGLDGSGAGI